MANERHRILVVDDLQDWCETIGGLLEDEGYNVQTAGSRTSALELLQADNFDLAVLDVRLDEQDEDNVEGLDLADKIKQHSPNVKVVIITGYDTKDLVRKALEPDPQGQTLAEDFIPKTETERLVKTVKSVLAKKATG